MGAEATKGTNVRIPTITICAAIPRGLVEKATQLH